jgi:hypothetical protein
MFTINLTQNVINEIFSLHFNPEPELSDETIATIDAIETQHGFSWSPISEDNGLVTFEII